MTPSDETFMAEALALAAGGRGAVEPNPMVGCLLVRDGHVIGRGFHERFGDPHAEVNALRDAECTGQCPAGATAYVTLEPCSHHGKTPPCADALVTAKLARVVVAMGDPDENVAGRGFQRLREAGIAVEVGCCAEEAEFLLAPYVTLRRLARPWVIAKWAETADGYLALAPGEDRWISGPESRRRVHELRSLCDAIAVGIGTALADDPLLTNRSGGGRTLARVVLDRQLRLPTDSQLVRTAGDSPVIVYTADATGPQADGLRDRGVEIVAVPTANDGLDLSAVLADMGSRRWMHLLVEGGPTVLGGLFRHRLVDEVWRFAAGRTAGRQGRAPRQWDVESRTADGGWRREPAETVGNDTLHRARRKTAAK